jgi:hypothetical protein
MHVAFEVVSFFVAPRILTDMTTSRSWQYGAVGNTVQQPIFGTPACSVLTKRT